MEDGLFKGAHGILIDVTAQRRVEESLRKSEEYFKAIIENSSDIILILDKLGAITYASPSIERFLGYRPDELIGKRSLDLIVSDDKPRAIADFGRALLTKEVPIPNVFRIRHKNGTERILEGIGKNLLDNPIVAGFVMNVRDITERKQAENALRESEERYRELTDFLPISISTFEVDAAGSIISYNRTALETFRYNEEDFKEGMNALQFFAPEEWQRVGEHMGNVIQGTSTPGQEFTFLRKDGSKFIGLIYASPNIQQNKTVGIRGVIIDITDRKRAEEALRESELRYRLLFEEADDGIALADAETGEIVDCNQALCRMTEQNKTELLGQPQSILHPQHHLINGHSSSFQSHKTGDPRLTLEDNLLSKSGKIIPVEIKASRFGMNGCDYLLGTFRDITERKRAEGKLKETLESLRKSFGATIQVLVSAVEMRDPYTAGHQHRSADLARAIATEMGLPQDKIDGIRMVGSIHDIGKLSIPAEILSKPTKLTDLEFSLIKEHSRIGYEMLKDVESSWPLAQIVYQHHERMDGSGYPRNLKGDEILMEARIMAVADVVEAMASHRPYRPTLGLDAALAEIQKNRGTLYDNTVVDACLKLFREKGYKLEGT